MDADWITSPAGRRVVAFWGDSRPAWLWSADGQTLIWRNHAARVFHGKIKKHGVRLVPEMVPIRGQVARIIRLGTVGRASLSRIQFLAGEKPVSVTCSCTPLPLAGGNTGLLIAGVDPVDDELRAIEVGDDALIAKVLPQGAEYLMIDASGVVVDGSPVALDEVAPGYEQAAMSFADSGHGALALGTARWGVLRLPVGDSGAVLLLAERLPDVPEQEATPEPDMPVEVVPDAPAGSEAEPAERVAAPVTGTVAVEEQYEVDLPVEPEARFDYLTAGEFEGEAEPIVADDPAPEDEPAVVEDMVEVQVPAVDEGIEPATTGSERRLSALFDRLADDAQLFTPLSEADDEVPLPAPPPAIEDIRQAMDELVEPGDEPAPTLFRVTGRGFSPIAQQAETPAAEASAPVEPAPATVADTETVERVSRYNFDELGRILNDRISGEERNPVSIPTGAAPMTIEAIIAETEPAIEPPAPVALASAPAVSSGGALVNLSGETLVLNRLPLGILVFRDQQVLFANRAITEMIGYESVEQLRTAGLSAIFPAGDGTEEAGPINHIVQRGGMLIPVTARLQSISWQGKPALMLSASATEVRTGHEIAVRAFAEAMADARGDGFVETNKNGIISGVSAQGRVALGRTEQQLLGRPLSALIDAADAKALQDFLARPARFAETARPCLSARANVADVDLLLFAQGQAGIVTGYFGFIRQREPRRELTQAVVPPDTDPSLLGRLSRSIRRPLNTIIGFSDLIRSNAFGGIENPRYIEYAKDIKTAGHEIAALVDELDDYTRLRDGRYAPRPADLDLAGLLESCVTRVRAQAGAARVLVRSAISERLPKVTADRASLGQAVLNLLASAIDQTPAGGSVVLSAQYEDDGSVTVHVRDSAQTTGDLGERFVVFRDGRDRNGDLLAPVRSSVGLALTRSLLAVNAFSLSVAPTGGAGMLFSMVIPAEHVAKS